MKFLKELTEARYRETDKDRFKRDEMEHELGGETEGRRRPQHSPGFARKHRFDTAEEDRRYLKVPFAEKDEAKRHKLKWSPEKKMWYYAAGWSDDDVFNIWDEVQ